ncbi:hypothetical protein EV132_106222 [Rhizobium sullae]|uniref:Uncharacterized protein n=1 Tax=Rhizobium sullae TaxID=50338 RepID=A0A4R3Q539_RHISU|nr:hypothetical protein EV132_106222 [Rhizobium sullae]
MGDDSVALTLHLRSKTLPQVAGVCDFGTCHIAELLGFSFDMRADDLGGVAAHAGNIAVEIGI